jgi:hypothetical protein
MSELLTLTAPIVPATRTTYGVQRLILDWTAQVIQAWLVGSDGTQVLVEWDGAQAVTLMTLLNSANLSSTSLVKNILLQAIAAGKLPAGAVTGTPS